jgi:hypothetical protein
MPMRKNQHGISLMGLIMGSVILIACAMIGIKLAPSYIEFFAIKKAVTAIAQEKSTASVAEIRKSFDARAAIDDITTVKGSDLEVTKEGGQVVINAGFRKEIPLAGNLGVYINFLASSKE